MGRAPCAAGPPAACPDEGLALFGPGQKTCWRFPGAPLLGSVRIAASRPVYLGARPPRRPAPCWWRSTTTEGSGEPAGLGWHEPGLVDPARSAAWTPCRWWRRAVFDAGLEAVEWWRWSATRPPWPGSGPRRARRRLFIDGGHGEGPRTRTTGCGPPVAPGSLLAVHDVPDPADGGRPPDGSTCRRWRQGPGEEVSAARSPAGAAHALTQAGDVGRGRGRSGPDVRAHPGPAPHERSVRRPPRRSR